MSASLAAPAARAARIAFFVPHAGCPQRCVFCDQTRITGQREAPAARDVTETCRAALETLGERAAGAQIAFFGGSFTALPRPYMRELLEAAAPFVQSGAIPGGIRLSTRPDAVDDGILRELHAAGVTAIELGAQSMDDRVLALCRRGHTAEDTRRAAARIHAHGFSLGLQMMTGLPGDTDDGARATARAFLELRPETVRIYPTLVLPHTALAARWKAGSYRPQALEEAVALCAELLDVFEDSGARAIRVGLQAEEMLQETLLAGPWHPAFRELCESERARRRVEPLLFAQAPGKFLLETPRGGLSRAVGHGGQNRRAWQARGYRVVFREADDLPRGQYRLTRT